MSPPPPSATPSSTSPPSTKSVNYAATPSTSNAALSSPADLGAALAMLGKICPVAKLSSAIFFSIMKRSQLDFEESVIFDCQARDSKFLMEDSMTIFKDKVDISNLLPPSKTCTVEDRDRFSTYLKQAANFKIVFAYSNTPLLSTATNPRMLFFRTLRYLANSGAKPKGVYLLDEPIQTAIQKQPLTKFIISSKIPFICLSTPGSSKLLGGFFVAPIERFLDDSSSSTTMNEEYAGIQNYLGCSVAINLARNSIPIGIQEKMKIRVSSVGPAELPIRTSEGCKKFYSEVLDRLIKHITARRTILLIDSSSRVQAAYVIAAVLVYFNVYPSPGEAVDFVKRRINPQAEMDAFQLASLRCLGMSPTSNSDTRLQDALKCLAQRYGDENSELSLEAKTGPSWDDLRKHLDTMNSREREPMLSTIRALFNNVLVHGEEDPKYLQVRQSNKKFNQSVEMQVLIGPKLMEMGGWVFDKKIGCWKFPLMHGNNNFQALRDVLVNISEYV